MNEWMVGWMDGWMDVEIDINDIILSSRGCLNSAFPTERYTGGTYYQTKSCEP